MEINNQWKKSLPKPEILPKKGILNNGTVVTITGGNNEGNGRIANYYCIFPSGHSDILYGYEFKDLIW